ncbi:MAG: hypothetical protein CMC16_04425 [Flavobacteriaceae bacterium]|nr:hypothetical protein [Flavobacteriaceae bacterium]
MKYPPFFDYLYLFISVFIFSDVLIFKDSISGNEILLFFGFLSLLMFFFRRYFRKKFNSRK